MFFSRNVIPDPVPFVQDQKNFEVVDTNILTNGEYFCSNKSLNTVTEENYDVNNEEENKDVNNEEENDVENEEGNDVEDDVEDDDEEDDDEEEDDETTIYVISFDNTPFTYERDLNSAKNNIDFMAKKYNLNDSGYHTSFIKYKDEYEINIIRSFDFGLFSYNYIMHTFSIHRLQK